MFPTADVVAPEAIIKTEESAGPIHGVHAKLKVNPIISAITGFIFLFVRFKLIFLSFCKNEKSKTPIWNNPNNIIKMPPILVNISLLLLKKLPSVVKDIPNMKKLNDICIEKGIRNNIILVGGGTQITNEIAKDAGLDAGFGRGTKGIDVASFIVESLRNRSLE